jgi:hypothetical protein
MARFKFLHNLKLFKRQPKPETGLKADVRELATPDLEFKAELKARMLKKAYPQMHAHRQSWSFIVLPFTGGILAGLVALVFVLNSGLFTFIGPGQQSNMGYNKREVLNQVMANNPQNVVQSLNGTTTNALLPVPVPPSTSKSSISSVTSSQTSHNSTTTSNQPATTVAIANVTTNYTGGPAAQRCTNLAPKVATTIYTTAEIAGVEWQKITHLDFDNQIISVDIWSTDTHWQYRGGQYAISYPRQTVAGNPNTTSAPVTVTTSATITSAEINSTTSSENTSELTDTEVVVTGGNDKQQYLITRKFNQACAGAEQKLISQAFADLQTYQVSQQSTYLNEVNPANLLVTSQTNQQSISVDLATAKQTFALPVDLALKTVRYYPAEELATDVTVEYLQSLQMDFVTWGEPNATPVNWQLAVNSDAGVYIPDFRLDPNFYANNAIGKQAWEQTVAEFTSKPLYTYTYSLQNELWQFQAYWQGSNVTTSTETATTSDIQITIDGQPVKVSVHTTGELTKLVWTKQNTRFELTAVTTSVNKLQTINLKSTPLSLDQINVFWQNNID